MKYLKQAILITSLCLTGCASSNEQVEVSNTTTPVPTLETQPIQVDVSEVLYQVEPSLEGKYVSELRTDVQLPYGIIKNYKGYPQSFNHTDYDQDAILLVGYETNEIISYEGFTLLDQIKSIPQYMRISKEDQVSYAFVMNGDKEVLSNEYALMNQDVVKKPIEQSGKLVSKGNEFKLLNTSGQIQDLDKSIVEILNDVNIGNDETCIIPKLNEENVQIGFVILNNDGTINQDLIANNNMEIDSYINDFVVMRNKETGKKLIYSTVDQGMIGSEYDDAKFFEDGFCPVKNDSKWTFIDESGNVVSDYLFQDVSTVYEGLAFVKVNNVFGVLRLKDTLEYNIPMTVETCKIDESIQEEVVEEVKDTTETKKDETVKQEPKKQMLKVKVDGINIRKTPSTKGEVVGKVENGSSYQYIDHKDVDGYKWFKIGNDKWIADDGTWFDLYAE